MAKIIAYKGFDKDLKCRDFQFAIGKTYKHTGDVKACNGGFHACENPLDVFGYYPPGQSRFCTVELSGKTDKDGSDSKVAARNIKLIAEIKLHDYIKIAFDFVWNAAEKKPESHVTGDRSASSATGDRSASSATGYQSASSATGDRSASSATGDRSASSATGYLSASSATGYRSASSATGYQSASSATGDRSASSATGYQSASSATGDRSASSATGYLSASSATGDRSASSATGDRSASLTNGSYSTSSVCGDKLNAVAIATGYQSKAKASKGNWIVLAEHDDKYNIISIKSAQAGKEIKPDTLYMLVNGAFVEA